MADPHRLLCFFVIYGELLLWASGMSESQSFLVVVTRKDIRGTNTIRLTHEDVGSSLVSFGRPINNDPVIGGDLLRKGIKEGIKERIGPGSPGSVTVVMTVLPGDSVYEGESFKILLEVYAYNAQNLQYTVIFGDDSDAIYGDFSSSTQAILEHTYGAPGNYTLRASVTDGNIQLFTDALLTVLEEEVIVTPSPMGTPITPCLVPGATASTGKLPDDFHWSVTPKEVPEGEEAAISYQVDSVVPQFNMSFAVDNIGVEQFNVKTTPIFGMTFHKFDDTGRHEISLEIRWGSEVKNLTDHVFVYRRITRNQVLFTIPLSVITPPGDITATITLTDLGELPTMIVGSAAWGDGHVTSLNFTDKTPPGASGVKTILQDYRFNKSGNFDVTLTLRNPISIVTSHQSIEVKEKLALSNLTLTQSGSSGTQTTFTAGVSITFTFYVATGQVTYYILETINGTARSLRPSITQKYQKAGTYSVSGYISGTAGESEKVTVEFTMVKKLLEKHVSVKTPPLVVYPPGLATISIILSSIDELPTDVMGSVSFTGGTTPQQVDFRSQTRPGTTQSVNQSVTHTYASVGLHPINLSLWNPVSSLNISKWVVRVVDHLTLSEIVVEYWDPFTCPSMSSGIVVTDCPLKFTAIVATGNASSCELLVKDSILKDTVPYIKYTFTGAGTYVVNMSCSGEAGTSPFIGKTVEVYQPISDTNSFFKVSPLVVWPPGEANATLTLRSAQEIPSHVIGHITWGDGTPDTPFDLTTATGPGVTGTISKVFPHIYGDSQVYTVTAVLNNTVTGLTLTEEIRVIDSLTLSGLLVNYLNDNDSPLWNTEILKINVPLNITALVNTGDISSFNLYVENQNISKPKPFFEYTFAHAGVYGVTVKGTGEAGESPLVSTNVSLEKPVLDGDLHLTVPNIIVWPSGKGTFTLMVTSEGELPTRIKGSVQWGDGTPKTDVDFYSKTLPGMTGNVSTDLVHTYTQAGNYTLTVVMKNNVSEAQKVKKVRVVDHLTLEGIEVEYANLQDKPSWDTTKYKVGASIEFTALVKTGVPSAYFLHVDGETKPINSSSSSISYTFQSAGDYQVNMSVSGEAGVSPHASITLGLFRVLSVDQVGIDIPILVVWPPGSADMTLTLTSSDELPTMVTGDVAWGDGSPSDTFDLSDETKPGSKGQVSVDLNHIYEKAEEVTVTVSLENEVSRITKYAQISVADGLTLSELVVSPVEEGISPTEGFYLPDQKISITPSNVVGKVDKFILSIPDKDDVVQSEPQFIVDFSAESDYKVSVRAEGAAGVSNTVSVFVRIRDAISGLVLKSSHSQTRVGLDLVFELQVPRRMGACLTLDLGERGGDIPGWRLASRCEADNDFTGEEIWQELGDETVSWLHRYDRAGLYTPRARFFSMMGEETMCLNITVLESLPCDDFRVWILSNGTKERPKVMTRADELRIKSVSSVNCSVDDLETDIEWTFYRINDSMEVDLLGADTSKGGIYLKSRTLHYGLYSAVVTYNISMTNPISGMPVWATMSAESIIETGKSELMAVITDGGAKRIRRGSEQNVTLRPENFSFDPDYPEIPLVSYSWACRLLDESFPADSTLISDPPSSRAPYESSPDLGGCWGEGPRAMSHKEGSITIKGEVFRNYYRVYAMQVTVTSADGRSTTTILEIEIVLGNPPVLNSACNLKWYCVQIKGAQLVNPVKLLLSYSCEPQEGMANPGRDGCGNIKMDATWSVFGVDIVSGDRTPVDLTGMAVGMKQQKLALLDSFWETYGITYKYFDVEVTATRIGEDAEGFTLQRLKINEGAKGGTCVASLTEAEEEEEEPEGKIDLKSGRPIPVLQVTALTDLVLCNCTGWVDPEGFEELKYTFYAMTVSGEKIIFSFSTVTTGTVILPYESMTLWAAVADPMGAETTYAMAEIEPLLPTKEQFDAYVESNALLKAVGKRDQTRVNMYLRAEKSIKGLTLPSENPDGDSGESESEEEAENKAKAKNTKMLQSVGQFAITSMDEVNEVNSILDAIADPLPKESQDSAVDALLMLSKAKDTKAPMSQQKVFASGTLSTSANLMKGVNKNVNTSTNVTDTRQEIVRRMKRSLMRMRNDSMDYNDYEEEEEVPPYEPTEEEKDANKKVGKMLGVVGDSQSDLLKAAVAGEEPSKIDAGDKVNMAVAFFDANDLQGKVVEIGGATYVFPSYCAILREEEDCLGNDTVTIGVKMTKWKDQVHGYGGGRDQLSDDSSTLQLSIVDADLNTIPVDDSLENFLMYIPRSQETIQEPELIYPNVSTLGLSVHNIYVPAPRVGVTIMISPENDSGVGEWVIAWSSSRLNGTPEYMDNLMYLTELTYHNDTGYYELFLDSDVIGNVTGMYSVAFGRYNYTIPERLEHPCFDDPPNDTLLVSFDSSFNDSYYLSTFTSSCLFFDNELLTWSSDGCTVIGANSTMTTCSCNHLTSFGSGFFVTPNTIDFSYVFANAGFADNLTIYLVLILTLALYFIGLIYARIMDKKDLLKVGATPLPDNDPEDKYLYDVMVHTGQFPSAGTKSKVQFIIVGDWNETDVRTLNDDDTRPLLTRGASDHFLLANDRPLGPLHYLRIWHDNSGKGKKASWYFSYMVVRDLQTGEEFQFICNHWLAVEEGDGQIDRLIPVAGDAEKRDRAHVFGKTVEKNISDDHLWFSVFLRPARSRFTRVQRLSACMALLYLSMLVNAMFYERVPDTPGGGGLNLGFFTISPEAMGVGFMSNLIVFPPSFLIVFFFRKARPRKPKKSRVKEALANQSIWTEDISSDTEGKGGSSFASLSGIKSASTDSKLSLKSSGLRQRASQASEPVSEPKGSGNKASGQRILESASSGSSNQQLITPADTAPGKEEEEDVKDEPYRRKKKLTLPWWFVIVAWILCAISIMVAVFFLWAYGIQFGNEKVNKWLTALVTSIFSSVLFTQPIKIYLTAMLLSYICKRQLDDREDYDDDEEDFDVKTDEKYLHGPPTGGSSRRRNTIQLGPGLSKEHLEAAKIKREKELAMQSLIFEIAVYFFFLLVILSVSYGSRDPNIYYMRQNIVNTFVESSSINCTSFVKAKQKHHLWCWANDFLIPNLMDPYLYNGEHRPQVMCGTLIDRISFLLGHPILRQIRTKPGSPRKHPVNHPNSEDERDFGMGWNETGTPKPDRYDYKSSLQLHGFPYSGVLDSYTGGGYLMELRGPYYKAANTMQMLEEEGWIDDYTKALFIEFAFYNPQVNLFAVCMFVFEFVPGGGLVTKFKFQALTLLRYHTPGGFYILLSEIAYLIFTGFYTRREYKSLKKLGRKYFKSVWNLMEIAVLTLSYFAIVFYLLKTSLSYYTIDKFTESKGKKYIKIQPLAFLDDVVAYLVSFQVFIGTLKLLKLLRFNKRIGMLSATLRFAAADIVGFGLLFIITLVSFSSVFYLNSLTYVEEFSTFMKAAQSSFFLINKKFTEIKESAPIMGPIFYFMFAFILYWLVFQLLIAIICHAFAEVSKDLDKQPNDYEVVEYIRVRIGAYISAFRPNTVQEVNIPPPRGPDIDSQLRHLNQSLDKAIGLLNKKKKKRNSQ